MNAGGLLQYYGRIADAPDAIARLRRLVLDLAVRGKLVSQDSQDEPAAVLLERIATEKARLVKAGELLKAKSFPNVDEEPYELPPSWRWTRVREIATDRGQTVPRGAFTYIDVTAINKEVGIVGDAKVLQADEAPSRARKVTKKGDVIYSCVRPYLLNVAVIDEEFDPSPIASTAFAVLNGHGLVLPRYIWIALRSPFMVSSVEQNMRGQAYPAINDSDFAVLPFPLPPFSEQYRIVAKVDELMALCDRLEAARAKREATRDRLAVASLARLNAPDPETFREDARFALDALPALTARPDQIQQLQQTILEMAFRGYLSKMLPHEADEIELVQHVIKHWRSNVRGRDKAGTRESARPFECDPAFSTPVSWGWMPLQFLCEQIGDIDHKMPRSVAVGVPFLSAKDLKDDGSLDFSDSKFISEEDFQRLSRKVLPRKGDIIYSRIGARLGKARLVEVDTRFLISYSCCLIRPLHSFIDNRYLQIFLDSPLALRQAQRGIQSIGVPDLGLGEIRAYRVPLPALTEQRRIVAQIDELMAICVTLEASLATGEERCRQLLEVLSDGASTPA